MERKLISFVVPCYNSERYIRETLDCLLNQTIASKIDIIAVNDGSTDSTLEILESYASRYNNIRVISTPNCGVSAARNTGIEKADGKYLMFVDSDDLIARDCAEKITSSMLSTGADMAICRIARGTEFNRYADSLSKESVINCRDKRILHNFLVMNKCYNTDFLKKSKIRFPSTSYSEDGAFLMSFILKTEPKIVGCYDAITRYRVHSLLEGRSVTQRISVKLINDFFSSMDIIYTAAKDSGCDDDYLEEINYKAYHTAINEFYRLMWFGDKEALEILGKRCDELRKSFSPVISECIKSDTNRELGEPVFDLEYHINNPVFSLKVKKPSDVFLSSVYSQPVPYFEIVTKNLPPDSTFSGMKNIKSKPSGKFILRLSGKKPVDRRLLKALILINMRFKGKG
ncbi:MAG: glycosyltransferase [Clostridiales bacterium]|nr:glycosyltransferase [Clostridiales bacterium]